MTKLTVIRTQRLKLQVQTMYAVKITKLKMRYL